MKFRFHPLLKVLSEVAQIVLFTGLTVIYVQEPLFDGVWRWAPPGLFALGALGACRGVVRAWREWRKWRSDADYSATG